MGRSGEAGLDRLRLVPCWGVEGGEFEGFVGAESRNPRS